MTLVGTDMVHILEEVLPGRFGGSLLELAMGKEKAHAQRQYELSHDD